jgi:hypothetical protein
VEVCIVVGPAAGSDATFTVTSFGGAESTAGAAAAFGADTRGLDGDAMTAAQQISTAGTEHRAYLRRMNSPVCPDI